MAALTVLAAIAAAVITYTSEVAMAWAVTAPLPLIIYLAFCHSKARKTLLAEQGRERDIVKAEFVAIAAERRARFWGVIFGIITIPTCITPLAIWAYQGWRWYVEGAWVPVTWLSLLGIVPESGHAYLQRLIRWLADTNMGVIVLIAGLLVAAPLAAVHRKSSHLAKLRRKDLVNLKKRS